MATSYPTDRFIGRADALRTLRARFGEGTRLLCVLGPAGMGKTRLVREFLRHHERNASREPTAWLCALSAARDLEGMCERVARALGVPLPAGLAPDEAVERLGRSLAVRSEGLLVLDNFEQLVPSSSAAVQRWLALAPRLKILVTSRARLGLAGESVYELGPLALPAAGDEASRSEALELFLERARMVRPDLRLEGHNRETVYELLRRLDGIPLAIELAAARTGLLGLGDLLARLPARLEVLSGARNDGSGRAETLRDALEWSWRLLDESDRETFMQCAAFREGFTLPAAESVLGAPAHTVLDRLQRLRDRSLVQREPEPNGQGHARLSLYHVLREFAVDKLRDHPALQSAVETRHREYYLRLGASLAAQLEAEGSALAQQQLEAEHDNLLAALEHALAQQPETPESASAALELALSMEPLFLTRGPVLRYAPVLTRALEGASRHALPATLLARSLRARAALHRAHGRLDDATDALKLALGHAEAVGHRALQGSLLLELGLLRHQVRAVPEAREYYERALAHLEAAGEKRAVGRTLGNIGALFHDVGDYEQARAHYHRALQCFRSLGDARFEGIFLTNLGILEHETQALDRAAGCYERALTLLQATGDARLTAITFGNLGLLQHERGSLADAQRSHERSLQLLRQVVDVRSQGLALGRLGAVLASLGHTERAAAALTEAEQVLLALGDRVALETVRLSWGFVALALAAELPEDKRGESLARAQQSVREARAPGPEPGHGVTELSDDARLLLRLLERALVAPRAASGPVLALHREGEGFAVDGGAWQDLRPVHSLRKLLVALARARDDSPGRGLPLEELQAQLWPGERILPEAAANRMYVALTGLRKRGLREVLLRTEEGYLLAPGLRLQWVAQGPDEAPPAPARAPRKKRG